VNSLASRQIVKPPALQPGDKVGLIAPASSFNHEAFERGCRSLRAMGYEPVFSPDIFDRDLYFAGSAQRRLRELESMLQRDDLAALIGVRGGYGSNYLLERVNFELFIQHPKIILGCSDLTTLLTAIVDRTGLLTFHGPMLAKDIADGRFEESSWNHAFAATPNWTVPTEGAEVLQAGQAQGRLYGGCLSLLVASLGTEFEVQTEGALLFIEDVAEKPYQIDRMLMQLRLAGKFKGVRGFIFGEMLDCVQPGRQDYTLQQVITRLLAEYKVPVVYGVRSGHVSGGNLTLPFGVQASLIADETGVTLKILESATRIG
jgi:muramoyltetrapeptide carboxypeptidase